MEYGKHLLVEVITKNNKDLANKKLIKKVFLEITKAIDVMGVLPPVIYQFPKKPDIDKKYPPGITAFYIITESHLSIHTWPENNYFAFDLFSCRNFDEKIVIRILKKNFAVKHIFNQIVERGLEVNFRDIKLKIKNKN